MSPRPPSNFHRNLFPEGADRISTLFAIQAQATMGHSRKISPCNSFTGENAW